MIRRCLIYLFLPVLAGLCLSCGSAPKPAQELGWPAPPRQQRVKYVRTLYGTQTLKRSFFGKIRDFLFGRAPEEEIGKPYGIAFDGDRKLYIADTSRKGIIVYDLKAGTAKFFNDLGRGNSLQEPVYVLLDRSGNIYVSDTKLGRVAVFTPDYEFSHFIGDRDTFTAPVGMAFDRNEDRLYIVDTRAHNVKVFDRDGNFLFNFGRRGDNEGEFYFPVTARVSDADTVYIVDSFHFAVQAFDRDGKFLFAFGPINAGGSKMGRPRDLAVDSDLNVYVTDANRNEVQIWSADGRLLLTFGQYGNEEGQFQLPAGICISDDMIYVADSINRRVQIFEYLADANDVKAEE